MRTLAHLALLLCLATARGDDASGCQQIAADWQSPMNPVPRGIAVAAGPVVFFGHRANGRDVAEMAQRLPDTWRSVLYGDPNGRPGHELGAPAAAAFLGWGNEPELHEETAVYVRARLREMLAGARLLVIDRFAWGSLPPEDRQDIQRLVEAGLGLVMPEPPKDTFAELTAWLGDADWQPLGNRHPALRLRPLAEAQICRWTVGRGRVSVVRYPRAAAVHYVVPHLGDRVLFNQGVLLSCAELGWAGQPPAALELLAVDVPDEVPWQPGPTAVAVRVRAAAAVQATFAVYVADERGEVLATAKRAVDVPAGDSRVDLEIDLGPGGERTVYVQAANLAAGAATVRVNAPATLGLEPVARLAAADQPLRVALEITGTTPADRLTVRVRDWWGRVLASVEPPLADGPRELALDAPHPRSRYAEVEAVLSRDDAPVAVARTIVYRALPHPVDAFHLYLWNGSWDRWWCRLDHLRQGELGENCVFSPGSGGRYLEPAIADNCELFSITHTGSRSLDKLCDPEFFAANVKKLTDVAAEYEAIGGAWAMSHGDELYIRGFEEKYRDWRVEPAHGALLAYLQRRYDGDIARLNAAWGTAFADFASLEIPDDLDIPKEPRAPWLDYCLFLEDVFCGYFERLNRAVNEQYPNARFGIDGIEKFSCFDGINWPRLQATNDVMVIYPHIDHDNKLYSWRAAIDFKRPGTVGSFWLAYGSDLSPEVAEQYPWMALFNGLDSMGYFQGYMTNGRYAALYPDWRARPAYAATAKAVRQIRDTGADKLLLNAERAYSPIAIHYSSRSLTLSFPDAGITNHINQLGFWNSYRVYRPGYTGHTANAGTAWMMMLSDMGYKPRFVDTAEIETGALKDYKVLVMPLSQSLTDGEIAAIEEFVRGGGMVVADYHCGARDGDGNLRRTGALADVFGLQETAGTPVRGGFVASEFIRRPGAGNSMVALSMSETLIAPAPTLVDPPADGTDWTPAKTHGEAAGGIPVLFGRPCGDGYALYLNFSIEPYIQWRRNTTGVPLRKAMMDILQSLGQVGPAAQVVGTGTRFIFDRAYQEPPAIGPQIHPFRDGVAEYLGIYWDYKREDWGPEDDLVKMTSPAHVYDVLTGEYHGFTARVPVHVEGCPSLLLARLPYRVESVTVGAPDRAVAGQPVTMRFAVAGAAKVFAPHTLKVTVRNAAGVPIPALGTALRAVDGEVSWTFVPALGETGELCIEARDVASGVTGTRTITVTAAP